MNGLIETRKIEIDIMKWIGGWLDRDIVSKIA